MRRLVLAAALWGLATVGSAAAQPTSAERVYLPNPADEDWSFLRDRSKWIDVWDRVKFVPLGDDARLTLSGEVRYRPEALRLRGVGERPTTSDAYLLQRYLLGASVRWGRRLRLFGEIQSGIINGKIGSPRPTDSNEIDFHQAFVEMRPRVGGSDALGVRLGRQELSIGSTRLISASPGLNVKRSFDGVTLNLRARGWTAAGAVASLVPVVEGAFNDQLRREQFFWGVAASRRSPRFNRGELGAYYLGIDRRASQYAQGVAPEVRHTIGVKWAVSTTRVDWNYDGLVQWGRFDAAPIRAWGFATETGVRVSSGSWHPRLSLRTDVASGDRRRDDPRLQAFNPLFPGNAYSGAVGLLGPTNLTDFTPAFTLQPRPNLVASIEVPSYWRTSLGDGLYSTDQRLLLPPGVGAGRYVGTNPAVVAVYQATRHLQLQGVVTRFLPGGFVEQTFVAKGFGFYSLTALYRF